MNWNALWIAWFGRNEWCGINLGFWAGMLAVLLIVAVMNIIVWSVKPRTLAKGNRSERAK